MPGEVLALFPPLVRFFIGLILVIVVAGGSALFIYWISTMYGEEGPHGEDEGGT
jgi:hypothetical protein